MYFKYVYAMGYVYTHTGAEIIESTRGCQLLGN